jgi:uncharacterized protein YceH (UPF0502 family)
LVAVLPRQPGTKESRYAHLLSGPVESAPAADSAYTPREPAQYAPLDASQEDRVTQLEAAVATLQKEIAELRQKFDDMFG